MALKLEVLNNKHQQGKERFAKIVVTKEKNHSLQSQTETWTGWAGKQELLWKILRFCRSFRAARHPDQSQHLKYFSFCLDVLTVCRNTDLFLKVSKAKKVSEEFLWFDDCTHATKQGQHCRQEKNICSFYTDSITLIIVSLWDQWKPGAEEVTAITERSSTFLLAYLNDLNFLDKSSWITPVLC